MSPAGWWRTRDLRYRLNQFIFAGMRLEDEGLMTTLQELIEEEAKPPLQRLREEILAKREGA